MGEKVIQTFKSHLIAVIARVSDAFPIHQWDELLPQPVLILNFLCQSNVEPNISAYSYHHGLFDYKWMPIAMMECAVQFHIKPSRRKSFGDHSADEWYLRTSPEHSRCHVVFVKSNHGHSIFQTQDNMQPTVMQVDAIVKAYHDQLQQSMV